MPAHTAAQFHPLGFHNSCDWSYSLTVVPLSPALSHLHPSHAPALTLFIPSASGWQLWGVL